MSNSLDQDETPSYSASEYGTIAVIGGLRVKTEKLFSFLPLLIYLDHSNNFDHCHISVPRICRLLDRPNAPNSCAKKSILGLTLSPPNKLSSARFLICFNFQSASMLLKVG